MKAVSVTWSVGASVMKKIKQGITMLHLNKAIWLDVTNTWLVYID